MSAPIDLSTAATLEQQAYQVALEMQRQELVIEEETRPDNTQVTFDTEANTVSVSITLGTTLAVTNGDAVISALPYLP